jgi:hypothetical protein
MAPQTKGMAQLMQGCGLEGNGSLPRTDQHRHLRFGQPDAEALDLHQAKDRSAMAGPQAAIDLLKRRSPALDPDLGPFRIAHQGDRHQG